MILATTLLGCAAPGDVAGLKPVSPPMKYDVVRVQVTAAPVESVQPELKWEPYRASGPQTEGHVTRVRYDLKVWPSDDDSYGANVYAQTGLPENAHRIGRPLRGKTTYCWTVRARFELDGETRVTDWSRSIYPWSPDAGGPGRPRGGHVLNASWFRFRTP